MLWAFCSFVYLIALIWLNAMFISKMYKVFRLEGKDRANHKIINVITKTTVLSAISSVTLVLFTFPFFSVSIFTSHHLLFVANIMLVIDLSANCLSIWLSYACFDGYYVQICGCCDRLFRSCIGGKTVSVQELGQEIQSASTLTID